MDIFKEVMDFLEKSPSSMSAERLAICKGCEYYGKYGICGKCRCVMAVKTRLPGMKCPVGKW